MPLPHPLTKFAPLTIIIVLWGVLNAILFARTGVKVVADTGRYVEYADVLRSGFVFDRHNFWYIGYAFYLSIVFKLFGSSMVAVVIGQYCFALLAIVGLYRSSFLIWKSVGGSMATCLLFILFVDISLWNSYLLTESLYTSFTCFSIYFLVLILRREASRVEVFIGCIIVVFTILIKPTGIALLTAVGVVAGYEIIQRVPGFFTRASIVLGCLFVLMILVNRMITTYLIIDNYQLGEVVYDVTTYKGDCSITGLKIDAPDDLWIPESSQLPIVKVWLFIFYNPIYWLKLFSYKVFFLLSHIRPFWSSAHNLYSAVLLLPAYVLFFKGLLDRELDRRVKIFFAVFLLVHTISVGVTSEDWDGRFLIPMLPVVFMVAGNALFNFNFINLSKNKFLRTKIS